MIDKLEFETGNFINGLEDIILGSHPIPEIYVKQDNKGLYTLIGERSRDILFTIDRIQEAQTIPHRQRKCKQCELHVVVFLPSVGQNELIEQYINAGFI